MRDFLYEWLIGEGAIFLSFFFWGGGACKLWPSCSKANQH